LEEEARKLEVEQIRKSVGKSGDELPSDVVARLSQHLQVLQLQTDTLHTRLEKETADIRRGIGDMGRYVSSAVEEKLSQSLDDFIQKVDKTCREMTTSSVDLVARFKAPCSELLAQKALHLGEGSHVQVVANMGRNHSPQRNSLKHSPPRNHSPQRQISGSTWTSPVMQKRGPVLESGTSSTVSAVMAGTVVGDTTVPRLHSLAEASGAMRPCQSPLQALHAPPCQVVAPLLRRGYSERNLR